eukprot:CAMPEP_0185739074 /NCGR_PEP_ID=MMETSP1171-20130828/34552_1 /TAXON_ID=374046 /ORGANISM="Helicotheca tamensis, Strain CCMP826" /LENGTH=130 /DNA_ID=CAMNT_0028410515 /DNA_START=53 /DNA_END=441 /DNA_ORIENTATION=+
MKASITSAAFLVFLAYAMGPQTTTVDAFVQPNISPLITKYNQKGEIPSKILSDSTTSSRVPRPISFIARAAASEEENTTPNDENSNNQWEEGGEAITRIGGIETGPTVWTEFGRLSAEHPDAANLGQGFP